MAFGSTVIWCLNSFQRLLQRKRKLGGVMIDVVGGVWKRHKSGCFPLLQVVGKVKLKE